MRIAVVSNTSWYLFNFRSNLMRALQADGHTVIAVAPRDIYSDRLEAAGFIFEDVPISGGGTNPFFELRSVFMMWRLLRDQSIDLVLSYTPKGNLYAALACMMLGVSFVPNVSGLGRAFIRQSFITRLVRFLYRLTFRHADHVFFQNLDDMKMFVSKGFVSLERSERLPGSGVDLSRFTPLLFNSFVTIEAPVFLLVARLLWDKGIGEYVQAARKMRQLNPNVRFQLLGFVDVANPSAISRAQVESWVAEGIIEYLGVTDDVRPFLAQASCVVLPSYREGVPRSLLEAAAMALPVITTDAPGCRDAVVDGETGFLCRVKDAQDLFDKLDCFVSLSHKQRQTMGQLGRAFVEKNFNEQFVLQRYLETARFVADKKQSVVSN